MECVYLSQFGDWCAHGKIAGIPICGGQPAKSRCAYCLKRPVMRRAILATLPASKGRDIGAWQKPCVTMPVPASTGTGPFSMNRHGDGR